MDNAVALVQAYLRINGYFTVAEYPILESDDAGGVKMATDIDILAFRFPGAVRQIVGRHHRGIEEHLSIPDPHLGAPSDAPDMIIGEVKEGGAHINKSMRKPAVIAAALARFGCCAPSSAEVTARKLLRAGRARTPDGHMVRIVVFAPGNNNGRRFQVVALARVADFLRAYLQEHWQVLHHAQFKDPVLSMLMTLEKAAGGPAVTREPRRAD